MSPLELNAAQLEIIQSPATGRTFLFGPAGSGKTTAAVERLRALLQAGVPGDRILLLTPQRTLHEPYLKLLSSPEREAGSEVATITIGGLARRLCDLFWPLVADAAGFAHPVSPPNFLTLETSQYFMARVVRPLLDQGYFESVTIDRNRLYAQILDNLNKAALVGFPHTQIGERLDSAYFGEPGQRRIYADAQDCAIRFRQYCLAHNLLDFSLQLEIFSELLWPMPQVRNYLTQEYRHLIYDNIEEDGARAHDLVREWLPEFDSALLIYDEGGGFRYFLGADVDTARALGDLCETRIEFEESFVASPAIIRVGDRLVKAVDSAYSPQFAHQLDNSDSAGSSPLHVINSHFYPQLLDAIADEAKYLIEDQGIPPSELVILAPLLSDALRFSLMNRLQARNIPVRSHRPSRSLREEPASRALMTLAAIAHIGWDVQPARFDVAYALMHAIEGMDLIRAQLLTEIVYRQRELTLASFDKIRPEVQDRITYLNGNRYSLLRDWIMNYRDSQPLPLDHFIRRLFGEVLSQPGFGFHQDLDSIRVAANLVESVHKFRLSMEPADPGIGNLELGKEYAVVLNEGVLAAQYLESWQSPTDDAVLIAPAHTFLMMNRSVSVQFWLDIGSTAWHIRLSQPLTHPYVLSREWQLGRTWSDSDEAFAEKRSLARLVSGLLHRCREKVYLGLVDLGESGYEQRGELLKAFQQVLQEEWGNP